MIYILMFITGPLILIRALQNWIQPVITETRPTFLEYAKFSGSVIQSQITLSGKQQMTAWQNSFMSLVITIGQRSLERGGSGLASFRLPDLQKVYVLSNPALVKRFFQVRNNANMSQQRFFTKLAILLGEDNLMSAKHKHPFHDRLRDEIRRRIGSSKKNVPAIVSDYFSKTLSLSERSHNLSHAMDKLSRRVLFATFFGVGGADSFERIYRADITKQLLEALFSIDRVSSSEKKRLLALRDSIFEMGYQLVKADIGLMTAKESWINIIFKVKLETISELEPMINKLGIYSKDNEVTPEECLRLLDYAHELGDTNLLSRTIRDVVNESLFIPLLGFDATATAMVSTLKIILQDKRVRRLIQQEHTENNGGALAMKSPWNVSEKNKKPLSYTHAVILEALRLVPPATVIPEVIESPIVLRNKGRSVVLTKGALVFVPLEILHHSKSTFPVLILTDKGKKVFGKKSITPQDIFPERWGPVRSDGTPYSEGLCIGTPRLYPQKLKKQCKYMPFKDADSLRHCPGRDLAIIEVASAVQEVANDDKVNLTGESSLSKLTFFEYDQLLQRKGGEGSLGFEP